MIPARPAQIAVVNVDLDQARHSCLRHAVDALPGDAVLGEVDAAFLAAETRSSRRYVQETIDELRGKTG